MVHDSRMLDMLATIVARIEDDHNRYHVATSLGIVLEGLDWDVWYTACNV